MEGTLAIFSGRRRTWPRECAALRVDVRRNFGRHAVLLRSRFSRKASQGPPQSPGGRVLTYIVLGGAVGLAGSAAFSVMVEPALAGRILQWARGRLAHVDRALDRRPHAGPPCRRLVR